MNTFGSRDFAIQLGQVLSTAGWGNRSSAIFEAMPHLRDRLERTDVFQTLSNLNVPYASVTCREHEISHRECPSIVFPHGGKPFFALACEKDELTILSSGADGIHRRVPGGAKCLVVVIEQQAQNKSPQHTATVADAFSTIWPMLPSMLLASLLVNVLGLLAPLLIMAVYDRVIPSGSTYFLASIAIGAFIILQSDFALRHMRTRVIAHVGMRAEHALSLSLFRKLMALPVAQLQKTEVDQQISRFRQFEALREVFTGHLTTSILDLPFVIIFLAVLFFIAPAVGFLAVLVAVLLVVHAIVTLPVQMRLDTSANEAAAHSRTIIQDAISHQKAIADLGLADAFRNRSLPLIEASEAATRKSRQFQSTQQTMVQTLTGSATVAAIILSTIAALDGSMSFGALIAVIALVSKVISPIAALHGNAMQLITFRKSQQQADRVLSLQEELEVGIGRSYTRGLTGAISLSGVTYKPDPLNAPLLSQVSLNIAPNTTALIMANNVSNRTAILDLIDGLSAPNIGSIELDGVDIRQMARDELRRSVTYGTYAKGLFYGTIDQNFRLAAPELSEKRIDAALDRLGLLDRVMSLPEKRQTRLSDAVLSEMDADFKQGLCLARCIARPSPILLLSEPTNALSPTTRETFKDWLAENNGTQTVLISTADRSLLQYADHYIYLDSGRLVVSDEGKPGLKKIQAALDSAKG